MYEYTSRYAELSFYVDGKEYKFTAGRFRTDDPKVAAVVDKLADAVCVKRPEEQPKKEREAEEESAKTENEARPARKTSAK